MGAGSIARTCRERNLLHRLEFDERPADAIDALVASELGTRMEDSWGFNDRTSKSAQASFKVSSTRPNTHSCSSCRGVVVQALP